MAFEKDDLPRPVVRKKRRARFLVWLIPLGAAVAAGFYVRDRFEQEGPLVTLIFDDASGIREEDTPVLHRGVEIGKVASVALDEDAGRAVVRVRLRRGRAAFASEGAAFWLVSPEVSETGVSGVNTLFSGPYIDSLPGEGKPAVEFVGRRQPPAESGGLHLVVESPHLEGLRPGAPVSYRGIQVGTVRDVRLARGSERVEVRLVVQRGYRALVRAHSRFWSAGGVDVHGGLLSGVELKVESLRSLISGGIAFATPEKDMGEAAKDGARFALEDQPPKDWPRWSPSIPIEPAPPASTEWESRLPTGRDLMEAKLK